MPDRMPLSNPEAWRAVPAETLSHIRVLLGNIARDYTGAHPVRAKYAREALHELETNTHRTMHVPADFQADTSGA